MLAASDGDKQAAFDSVRECMTNARKRWTTWCGRVEAAAASISSISGSISVPVSSLPSVNNRE